MRTLPTTGLVCVLLLTPLLLAGRQEPPPQVPPQSAPERVRVDRKKLREDMQGAWKLVELRAPDLYAQARQDVGFCLIAGNCLSLELHLGWVRDGERIEARTFQSGMHTFEINDEGQVKTSSLIGAYISRSSALEFEPPGATRTYGVALAANRLTLSRPDGQVLVFDRMLDAQQGRDFFGRPLRERAKKAAEKVPEKDKDQQE